MFLKSTKPKVFCIGLNKTGTTTIATVLKSFGYRLGNQIQGELLLEDWDNRNFDPIIKYCKTADAFQDIPFSLPYTFEALDQYYKNAKFILTTRDSPVQWYNSLVKFHSKLWSDGKNIPTIAELKDAPYRYKGFAYKYNQSVFNTPEANPYQKDALIDFYNFHNQNVKDYFKSRSEKLLVINVSKSDDYAKLCLFLNQPIEKSNFPWKNKTSELK